MEFSRLSDQELIREFLGGAAEGFEELVARHEAKVFNFARVITGDLSDAETVLAEVFIELSLNIGRIESEASVQQWLLRETLHKSLEIVKKREARSTGKRTIIIEEDTPLLDRQTLKEQQSTGELKFIIEHVLVKVPEDYKQVFLLRDVHGLSVGEIATVLSVEATEIKLKLHRARLMISRYVKRLAAALDVELTPTLAAANGAPVWSELS